MAVPSGGCELDLRTVRVRPTQGAHEHRRWDRLMAAHHYLSFTGLFGKALRQVATLGEQWIALLGWQAAALKLAARDRWIGWTAQQRRQRLHLVLQNSRFVILPAWQGQPNLASRVLGLSVRRLSDDMLAAHGFPILLAESFVDRQRFAGTCYRAANWRWLGQSGGYARVPAAQPQWRRHGQPKEVFVYEVQAHAAQQLAHSADDPRWAGPERSQPPDAQTLRSLFEFLGEVPEYRHARGKRYELRCVLTLAVAARLCGYRGVTACAQFAALLDQGQRAAVECFRSPSKDCYTSPSITTFHNILASLEPQTLEQATRAWAGQQSAHIQARPAADAAPATGSGPAQLPAVSLDGKDVRGASKQTKPGRRMLLAAVEQDSGVVLGQLEIDSKSNEIPAFCDLARQLPLQGRVVTGDALHAQQKTARCVLDECQAEYLITAIKGNQPTILADLRSMDFSDCPLVETSDRKHGRIEHRSYQVKDISAAVWDDSAQLYGRQQAIRVERRREHVKTGKCSTEVTYALTSLSPAQATPQQLAQLLRKHWHIENRLHYVRDFTYDEDRCRVYVRDLPRNLACLTNTAISIIRGLPQFRYLPQANRHFAARPQEALDCLLQAPRH